MNDPSLHEPTDSAPRGRARLLLSNVVKDRNLAALLRTADAFGVDEVVVVGRRRIARAGTLSVGMAKFLRRRSFLQLDEAVAHLRADGFRIIGIEVDEAATPIEASAPKDDKKGAHIRVLAVTAFAMRADEQRVREAGCEGYLSKPIQIASFIRAVEALMPKEPAA